MSDHGINVTYKSGAGYDAHWITVGADDEETWHERNDAVTRSIAAAANDTALIVQGVGEPNPVGMQEAVQRVASELGGVEVHASPENVPTSNVVPINQGAEQGGGLPEGVRVYVGPQPDNAQYKTLFIDGIDYPTKEELNKIIETQGYKYPKSGKSSFLKFNGKDQPYTTPTQNEALVRQFLSARA